MTTHFNAYSTRSLSLLMLAGFVGIALWMFAPWGGSGSGIGGDSNASLPPSLRVDGEVGVTSVDNVVTQLVVPVSLRGEPGIDLSDGKIRAETSLAESAAAAVPATFAVEWIDGNGDSVLDPGERALLTVNLPEKTAVHPQNPLRLVIQPSDGVSLAIEDVLN